MSVITLPSVHPLDPVPVQLCALNTFSQISFVIYSDLCYCQLFILSWSKELCVLLENYAISSGLMRIKGDTYIVFLVLYYYKAISSLGIYSCYSFIPLSLLSQSCLDLLYSPLINCLQSPGPAWLWSPIRTREISDHRSTTLPTGRQVSVHSAVSTHSLYGVYQIHGSSQDRIGSAGGSREISRAEICTSLAGNNQK